jgi:dTDP-4-dehydrorhamnose reductase
MLHVIGASSFIGKNLIDTFKSRKIDHYIAYSQQNLLGHIKFNLLDLNDLVFQKINKNDVIIFLSALSSPDFCESNYIMARSVNVDSTSIFIKRCLSIEAKVIFISSDVVYGGNNFINNELSIPNPVGKYAQMKYEIEDLFNKQENFKVLRLSYVLSENDKFFKYLSECFHNNEIAEVYDGLHRNVVWIEDVLESIINLSNSFSDIPYKVINVCGDSCLSRVDLLKYYIKNFNAVKYKIVDTPLSILTSRPNKIEVHSLYLEKLINKKPLKIKGDKE